MEFPKQGFGGNDPLSTDYSHFALSFGEHSKVGSTILEATWISESITWDRNIRKPNDKHSRLYLFVLLIFWFQDDLPSHVQGGFTHKVLFYKVHLLKSVLFSLIRSHSLIRSIAIKVDFFSTWFVWDTVNNFQCWSHLVFFDIRSWQILQSFQNFFADSQCNLAFFTKYLQHLAMNGSIVRAKCGPQNISFVQT